MKITLIACLLFTTLLYGQCPVGDVVINSQLDVDQFVSDYPNCDTINGDLLISGPVTNLSTLDYLQSIEGEFIIQNTQLTTISNFDSLIGVLNRIQFSDNALLTEIVGFNALIDLGSLFSIENNPNLVTINGFNNATDVFGDFWINNNASLETINGFGRLATVRDFLAINDSPLLVSIPSFNNLIYVGWSIQFHNTGLTDIPGFENLNAIGGIDPTSGFVISNNLNLVTISGFNCLESVAYDFFILDNPLLENIMGLSSLESVGQFFTIRNNASLATLNGLQDLTSVSTTGYETTVVFEIHDNPQLSDCDPLCNLLSSNGIIGLTNISNNLTGCNALGEIETSNCIPFQSIECTSLTNPLDGDIDVAIDTNISWNPIAGATSYLISIGTSPEGVEIADNLNVGNITTYDLPTDLPENTEIFVKVKPFNNSLQAKCCVEESFITEAVIPECTNLSQPVDEATNVSITTSINWNSVLNATGYIISIGTFSGGTDIADQVDVGNTTTYNPTTNLPENSTIFVTISPYNSNGDSPSCLEEQFSTQVESIDCSSLTQPLNGAMDVDVATTIIWNTSENATGYILNIGLTPTGSEIINNLDMGNETTFSTPENLPFDAQIYVSIIPYNSLGQALSCQIESFTTKRESIIIPKFFTPNNDEFNNTWIIIDPFNEIEIVYIYDRYGKLIKTLYNLQNGWNGLFNNQALPANDYWYIIKLKDGSQRSGHFSLKR